MLCVVELSTPTCPFIRFFYDLYTLHVIPAIGSLKSHDADAYRYLPRSIAAVPQGKAMLNIMRRVGFTDCRVQTLTLGTCSIYTAVK
jgi:demethylmenaquinone methyltransferase/2-methoxy-6-polyprenyl-1,4-benzoquinol methylase